MLTRKKLYHTIAIITKTTDWKFAQYWLDQGYTEAASHSADHFDTWSTGAAQFSKGQGINYEWEVNGSKNDIVGNLDLPQWWKNDQKQYVYAWIDPYGRSNNLVEHWLGVSHYLLERGTATYPSADPVAWDSANNLFEQTGVTKEIGPKYGGETSVSALDSRFDSCYRAGQVYHLMAHPAYVDWSKGGYADQHTDYICRRTDVWYVPLGILSLYRWISTRNVTHVTRISPMTSVFKISIDKDAHETYGASYPVTYSFKIPSNWTRAYIYCKSVDNSHWKLMANENAGKFFDGTEAVRFDFSTHTAYVSIAFRSQVDNLYLQILSSPMWALHSSSVGRTPS